MSLSSCHSYGIEELVEDWSVNASTVRRWLVTGKLKCWIWQPVMSVYALREKIEGKSIRLERELSHFEGFIPLSHLHCQRLFRLGYVTLRDFSSTCGKQRYELPHSSDDITARWEHLLVTEQERERFERSEYLGVDQSGEDIDLKDQSFRLIEIDGESYRFGDMQAAILGKLQQAALEGTPWQYGKQILEEVGSESFTLSNVFKHKPVWRKLVDSDGRGRYRLREDVMLRLTAQPPQPAMEMAPSP